MRTLSRTRRPECPEAVRLVVRDGHPEPLRHHGRIDATLAVGFEWRQGHAHVVPARAFGPERPTGDLLELRGSEVQPIQRHGETLPLSGEKPDPVRV
jgi:hypothetical protein